MPLSHFRRARPFFPQPKFLAAAQYISPRRIPLELRTWLNPGKSNQQMTPAPARPRRSARSIRLLPQQRRSPRPNLLPYASSSLPKNLPPKFHSIFVVHSLYPAYQQAPYGEREPSSRSRSCDLAASQASTAAARLPHSTLLLTETDTT